MARRSVQNETSTIDPVFFIPDGVDELLYSDDTVSTSFDDAESDDTGFDVDVDESDFSDPTDYDDSPETPQILDIFSQTVRAGSTGAEVVDVVFDVEDIAGFTNYELRVTKI